MPSRALRPLTPDAFVQAADVSRETLGRLTAYIALLRQWQVRINLVSAQSLGDVWRRHVLDSAQLRPLIGRTDGRIYDLGSGAGFPALVLAIMGQTDVHLIESDQRKAAFLREAARITAAPATIHAVRAESLAPRDGDFVTARACAPLPELLELAAPLLKPSGACIFLKGGSVEAELTAAHKTWSMRVEKTPSQTDPTGIILRLEDIERV